jgi:conjugative transposon TraN protein
MKKLLLILLSSTLSATTHPTSAQPLAAPDTISAYPLTVTERFTTNLLFPAPIFRVDLGSGDILARKMGKTENVLLLKANRPGVRPTNVSVYLADGEFYSFIIRYADTLANFNYSFGLGAPHALFTSNLPDIAKLDSDIVDLAARPPFLHAHASDGGLHLTLRGIYNKDGLLWLTLLAANRSTVDFEREGLRILIADRHPVRRTATQTVELTPLLTRGGESLSSGRHMPIEIAIHPLTLPQGTRMLLEYRETTNGRRIQLTITRRQLLRAQKIE